MAIAISKALIVGSVIASAGGATFFNGTPDTSSGAVIAISANADVLPGSTQQAWRDEWQDVHKALLDDPSAPPVDTF